MLRIKRSIQEAFASQINVAMAQDMISQQNKKIKLEEDAQPQQAVANAEGIDLDDDDDEDAVEAANSIEIKEKAIPSSLFSGIGTNDKPMGALDRIRMAKQGQK